MPPKQYQRVVIPGLKQVSDAEFRQRVAIEQQKARLYQQRRVRASLPRRKRTYRYTKEDFDWFDKVEAEYRLRQANDPAYQAKLYAKADEEFEEFIYQKAEELFKLTKAQLVQGIIDKIIEDYYNH